MVVTPSVPLTLVPLTLVPLTLPLTLVRRELHKPVGILNPHTNPSRALLPHIDFIKQIRAGVLNAAQFPVTLTDKHGTFTKPVTW
jgi:hypothetical protein